MRRKQGNSSLGILFLFGLIIGGVIYLYNSELFERNRPNIVLNNNGYWNLNQPLKVTIDDTSGIKSYKVILKSSTNEYVLHLEQLIIPAESINLDIKSPRTAYRMKDKSVKVIIEATDASKWNFLKGNRIVKEFKLKVDIKRPRLEVVSNSYKINKGGSAVVVFKASDENLKDIYIQTNYGKKFKPQPFYKKGYYISLMAWPIMEKNFRATIVATDKAGNKSKGYIPIYLIDKKYRVSNIKLKKNFLKGKIAELAEEFEETQGVDNSLEQFKIINEDVRAKNEKLIHEITSIVSDEMIFDFNIKEMDPLKSAITVANFGDHRKYSYRGKDISESYHLGIDMASFAMAKIKPKNSGDIVFSDFNGLYGNMPIVHHGLGLHTLYGHCSSVSVNNGDFVNDNVEIARTGKSGYAMGDHVHFGILVQGIEVRPSEWMNAAWIKIYITDVIKNAKNIIDKD